MTTTPREPPPWPIPPSWPHRATGAAEEPERPRAAEPEPAPEGPRVVVLGADAPSGDPPAAAAFGQTTVRVSSFEAAYDLAGAVARAVEEGADGIVVLLDAEESEEAAWALDLLYSGRPPVVVISTDEDLADAVRVAAELDETGCVVVGHGEIHAARYAGASAAGPLGRVEDGEVRLLWRPPERITLHGPFNARPRVGLYTVALGEDGDLLRALAGECDGLVVTGRVAGQVAGVLADLAERMPVVVAGAAAGERTTTALDPLKARVLMHLLLAAGRDREAVLAAFS